MPRGQCGPRRRAGPARRRPGPAGKLRAPARGRSAGARRALPSRPRLRPTRVPAAPGAPGPAGAGASLLNVRKVASGPSASGLEGAAARRVGGRGPWARRPELLSGRCAPAARRGPTRQEGDRKGCEPRPARGIRNRRVRFAAEEAVTPDGSVWPPLGLEGKAASLGSRGEKSVYKTKALGVFTA